MEINFSGVAPVDFNVIHRPGKSVVVFFVEIGKIGSRTEIFWGGNR